MYRLQFVCNAKVDSVVHSVIETVGHPNGWSSSAWNGRAGLKSASQRFVVCIVLTTCLRRCSSRGTVAAVVGYDEANLATGSVIVRFGVVVRLRARLHAIDRVEDDVHVLVWMRQTDVPIILESNDGLVSGS